MCSLARISFERRDRKSARGPVINRFARGVSEFVEIAATLVIAALIRLLSRIRQVAAMPMNWFRRHVYYRDAPFRSVNGSYVLVLRSFANSMAIGRRIRRIFRDQDGREIDTSVIRRDPQLRQISDNLSNLGWCPDLGEARPDLTLITFLGEVRARYHETFVGVSNGSSLGGALRLVHAPDKLWFDAMKVLAAHAKAILVIPDNSESLVQEVAHVIRAHPCKVAFIMPPSDTGAETRWDVMKEYRFEGIDLSQIWSEARRAMQEAGVTLPSYDRTGGVFRCHPDSSVCEAKWVWSSQDLTKLIATMDICGSDAKLARRSLRAVGVRLLRYRSPPGSIIDESWYKRQFKEDFHIRDAGLRRRLAIVLPWLGLDRDDHVMNAPLPGQQSSTHDSEGQHRCGRCPEP
jgi:hypothetical protein